MAQEGKTIVNIKLNVCEGDTVADVPLLCLFVEFSMR